MTGMRRGEIAKLKWLDVDLESRYIYVNETKNDDCRSIPINDSLYHVIINLKQNATSIYVFTIREGKAYTGKNLWRTAWDNAFKKAGIDYCTFHHLRHTFTSRLIVDEKEDYATVMALTGHKDIRMLQRYSHTREEAKKIAINKLSNNLFAERDVHIQPS
jgi:integrase